VLGQEDSTLLATTPPNTITFEDNTAEVGTRYRYCVKAQTGNGLVSRANCDSGIRARLPRPGVLSATRGTHDDRIELTWADRSSAEDAYHVYRRPQDAASETFRLADAAPGASFEYMEETFDELPDFDALTPDSAGVADSISVAPAPRSTDYALRYRAALRVPAAGSYTFYAASDGASRVLVDGEAIVRNGDVRTAQEDSSRVQLEEGVHALTVEYVQRSGAASLTVGWSGPSFDRTALQGDRVVPDLGTRIARLPANRTELTDEEIEPGRRYVYHVVGVAGDGGISTAAATLGRRARIVAPASVTATDSTFEDRVRIEWESEATRAAIYQVYRDGERIKTVSAPQQTYADDRPIADTRHRYCVEAVTDRGVVSGQTCDYGSRHLKAPSNLSASNGTEEDVVRLTWSDNSQVEDTTFIRRDGMPLDTLVTPLTEYADPTAVPGTRHTYGVYVVGGGAGLIRHGPRHWGPRLQCADGRERQR
jgi:hypothetical protein